MAVAMVFLGLIALIGVIFWIYQNIEDRRQKKADETASAKARIETLLMKEVGNELFKQSTNEKLEKMGEKIQALNTNVV